MIRLLFIIAFAWLHASSRAAEVSLANLRHQNGAGFPKNWGTNNGAAVPADYEMDAEILNDPKYRSQLDAALKSVPSMFVVMKGADLFQAEHGIYAHPLENSNEWERPASVEMINTNGNRVFQVNCGIKIQGGWNRRPEESPKHAFRLVFKKKYGIGKLNVPVFGAGAAREFDSLILRAGCNNSWLHWSGVERRRAEFLRDQWMRDTFRAMGHPSPHGTFVHLFLNGLYWGLYNLCERPDESFAAAYLGGKRDQYDSRNADKVLEGDTAAWDDLFKRINSGVKTEKDLASIESLLDLDSFIDYMLVNFYGANADWDRASNWYAARRRVPGSKFHFFVWDAERTLEQIDDDTMEANDDQSPTRIFHQLRTNEAFRKRFSERAHRHCSTGGPLSPTHAAERYKALATQIELAVILESARWGDYRRDVHRYKEGPYELYTPELWKSEVNRLLNDYFPKRAAIFNGQLRTRGLY